MHTSRLEKLTIRDAEFVIDDSGEKVMHVNDPHALSQAAGYLKHTHATKFDENIYFRGQCKLYSSLVPALFRGAKSQKTLGDRAGRLHKRIVEVVSSNKIFEKFHETFREPLLQHYGLKTTWIDVVDNVWIALWFACFEAKATGSSGQYVHFEERKEIHFKDYAYILLLSAQHHSIGDRLPGLEAGATTEAVDLRLAVPSIFLRPHSQHGLLVRMRGQKSGARPRDYSPIVRGIIRVTLVDAMRWLGRGSLVDVHSLFPPPTYDEGYEYLLRSNLAHDTHTGGIVHIGA